MLTYRHSDLPLSRADLQNFFVARWARIWPAHIFATVLLLTLVGTASIDGAPGTFPLNVLLLQGWIPVKDAFFSYNGLSWTVSTELGFYLLFPLLIQRWAETWWRKLLLAVLVVAALITICAVLDLPDFSPTENGTTTLGVLYINPLGRLLEFVIGMIAALAWQRIRPAMKDSFALWTLAEVASMLFVAWSLRFLTWDMAAFSLRFTVPGLKVWAENFSGCISFAVLIFTLASGTGAIGRLLSLRSLVFLGDISYSVYMLHQILIRFYLVHMPWAYEWPMPIKFSIFLAVLFAASAAAYVWVEVPARVAIRKRFSVRRRDY